MQSTAQWCRPAALPVSSTPQPRLAVNKEAARATPGSLVVVEEHDPARAHQPPDAG